MERQIISSSSIQSVGYDSTESVLEVEFNRGAVYQYHEVPPHVHEEFMSAPSAGTYLNQFIKNSYNYEQV